MNAWRAQQCTAQCSANTRTCTTLTHTQHCHFTSRYPSVLSFLDHGLVVWFVAPGVPSRCATQPAAFLGCLWHGACPTLRRGQDVRGIHHGPPVRGGARRDAGPPARCRRSFTEWLDRAAGRGSGFVRPPPEIDLAAGLCAANLCCHLFEDMMATCHPPGIAEVHYAGRRWCLARPSGLCSGGGDCASIYCQGLADGTVMFEMWRASFFDEIDFAVSEGFEDHSTGLGSAAHGGANC